MKLIPKILTSAFIIIAILQVAGMVTFNLFYEPAKAEKKWQPPTLSILDPIVTFSDAKCDADGCEVPWIADMIKGLYNYAIRIVGIISAIVIMYAGVLWLTAGGNTGKTGEAKKWIEASLTGLVIALSSYLMLNLINPELVKLKPLSIGTVEEINLPLPTGGGYFSLDSDGKPIAGKIPPEEIEALIKTLSAQYGVDPNLIKAIMMTESAFNSDALSPAGAIGLMQLMPETAKFLKVNPYDPADNAKGGVKYIQQMLQRYSGNLDLALMAYNWGPGNADSYRDKGVGIKGGPVPAETRNYLTRVKGYMEGYSQLGAHNDSQDLMFAH